MPEAKPQQTITDSVFHSLFSEPESRFALFQAIHPDVTDISMGDIQDATIPHMSHDLALLVQNTSVMFILARSAWTDDILLQLFQYWALHLQGFISANQLNLNFLPPQSIPAPEFYVIYTGDDHLAAETLSLGKDFFHDPMCPVDLTATIIRSSDQIRAIS